MLILIKSAINRFGWNFVETIAKSAMVETHANFDELADGASQWEFDLGLRLKQARIAAHLSQRQLALRADISNTTISLIEQNRTSPSVAMLKRILAALPVSLSDFFDGTAVIARKSIYRAAELAEVSSGSVTTRRLELPGEGAAQIMHTFYQPGADTGNRVSTSESLQGGVIVRGHLQVTIDGVRSVLGPGDAYSLQGSLSHRFCNTNRIECEVVSVFSTQPA